MVAPARAAKTYAPGPIRTADLSLRRRALYPLSYGRRGTTDSKGLSAHADARATPSTLRNTPCAKAEESTTPDLVELTRQAIDASQRGDYDAIMRVFAPDVVWEPLDGLGVFEGPTAVRCFLEDFAAHTSGSTASRRQSSTWAAGLFSS